MLICRHGMKENIYPIMNHANSFLQPKDNGSILLLSLYRRRSTYPESLNSVMKKYNDKVTLNIFLLSLPMTNEYLT